MALHMIVAILQRAQKRFKSILAGIKLTWNKLFSRLAENFSSGHSQHQRPGDPPGGFFSEVT
jgi:hypothetical protein